MMNFDNADKAMKLMNRRNLRLFSKLRQMKFDELNLLRAVDRTYESSIELAKKQYKKIAEDAFIEALLEIGWLAEDESISSAKKLARAKKEAAKHINDKYAEDAFIEALLEIGWLAEDDKKSAAQKLAEAKKEAAKHINDKYIDKMLNDYDPMTLYRFLPEAERKKQRLVEALIAAHNKGQEIDKALRLWTLQISAYADRSVIDGTKDGYRDAGVNKVRWVAVKDERTCEECMELDGKVFEIDDVPPRCHFHCRCIVVPVKD